MGERGEGSGCMCPWSTISQRFRAIVDLDSFARDEINLYSTDLGFLNPKYTTWGEERVLRFKGEGVEEDRCPWKSTIFSVRPIKKADICFSLT